ncbi:unnamed protein product, partial [Mesorhabditis spiculigera]
MLRQLLLLIYLVSITTGSILCLKGRGEDYNVKCLDGIACGTFIPFEYPCAELRTCYKMCTDRESTTHLLDGREVWGNLTCCWSDNCNALNGSPGTMPAKFAMVSAILVAVIFNEWPC